MRLVVFLEDLIDWSEQVCIRWIQMGRSVPLPVMWPGYFRWWGLRVHAKLESLSAGMDFA